jgi:hypothetical protein
VLHSRLHLIHQPREIAGIALILFAGVVALAWRDRLPVLSETSANALPSEAHA